MNSKLIFTLNGIGLDANDYLTDIPQVIFKLMGIKKQKRTDVLYQKYYAQIKQVEYLDLRVEGEKSRLSKKIYNYLLTEI